MAQLTTAQLIKILLGIFVVVVVVAGISFFFKDRVINFFKGLASVGPSLVLSLV